LNPDLWNRASGKAESSEKGKAMHYITPIRRPSARSLVGQVYRQVKQDMGVNADLFRLHSPVPELLAGLWGATRETEIVGRVPWPLKQAVAAAVSQINRCPYCVEIHTALAEARMDQPLAELIAQGRVADIADPYVRSVVLWAQATRSPGSALLLAPPFTPPDAPEIMGIAVVSHYVNRMVEVFLPESLLPAFLRGARTRQVISSQVGRWLARRRDQAKVAGASLQFLPEAPVPAEMAWAAPSPAMSGAFARWAAAVERAGTEILSPQVRTLVTDFLRAWKGEVPGPSRAWVNQAVAWLPERERAAGRLTLLAALAPFQIDEELVQAFRAHHGTDAHLVGAVAWASFAAAQTVASWLQAPADAVASGTFHKEKA
jgi:AhpD family alkylhydroperoxidase